MKTPQSVSGKRRRSYAILLLVTVAIGLAVHLQGMSLAPPVRDVAGDALWAAMIFWLISLTLPAAPLGLRAAAALAVCFMVEITQLMEHPLLNAFRSSTLGHLVIGSDFDARDLAAYSAGVFVAALVAKVAVQKSGS